MMTDEEFAARFISKFHNLAGLTVGEKRKKIFHLFNNSSILQVNNSLLNKITEELQPATYLQYIFFLDFLIHFRRFHELKREVFENENCIALSKITKQRWFFEKCISENPTEFVKQIAVTTSYYLTLKLLKNIAPLLTEESGDEIFDFLYHNNGLLVARKVITCCSIDKIKATLKNNFFELPVSHLMLLFDKSPDLIHLYLEEREKHYGPTTITDLNQLFKHIASRDVDIFEDLSKKYEFKIKLGRKLTKRLILLKRTNILASPKLYVKNLHPRCLVEELGSDFPSVFLKLFARKVEDSPNSEASSLLKYYPKNKQYHLLVSTYNQIFAKKIEDSPHLIDDYILRMIPDPGTREEMAKRKDKGDPELYLQYFRPENCLKIIKRKINFARDSYERSVHVATLTECCLISHDCDTLLDVAKFVSERFKNDYPYVLHRFLQVLLTSKVVVRGLNEHHWKEIAKITASLDETTANDFPNIEIFYKHIEYLLRQNKPILDEMKRFYKTIKFNLFHLTYLENKCTKKFLNTFMESAEQLTTSSEATKILDCTLLAACLKYNQQNHKDPIDVFKIPRLSQSVRSALENEIQTDDESVSDALKIMLCNNQTKEDIEQLRHLYWKNMKFANCFIMKWFVKYRPDFLEKYLVEFLQFSLSQPELLNNKKIWCTIKCYSHLNIDTRIIQFCSANPTTSQCIVLSYFMEKHDYLKLVECNNPVTLQHKALDKQIALLKCLKNNAGTSVQNLPVILQYCVSNYAPFCRGPIFRTLQRIPNVHIANCIAAMKDRNIPWLTKYAYEIISMMYKPVDVLRNLEECSLCLGITFKYFVRNPSEDSWNLVIKKLHSVEQIDAATSKLIATTPVPKKYKTRHFENIWTLFHRTENKYMSDLLKKVQKDTIKELQPDFMHLVISSGLFNCSGVNKVASIYLVAFNAAEKMNLLLISLQQHKVSKTFSRERMNFVTTLMDTYMQWEGNNDVLIDNILGVFQQVFSITEIFEEYVLLHFLKLKNQSFNNLSASVIEFYNTTITRFGETVIEIFADILKRVLPYFCKSCEEIYEFYYLLLSKGASVVDALLVIHLLPNGADPEDAVSFKYYQQILQQLQDLDFLSVQLYLNLYFQNRTFPEDVSYYERVNSFCISNSSWLCHGARRKIGYCYY